MSHSNWGNYPITDAAEHRFQPEMNLSELNGHWIPRGMGRCYGDSSLGDSMISILPQNRFLAFDEKTGVLKAEAGVTYADLLEAFVPKGWFPPVTPGTKFVSLGGAIASDVHGKNHHKEGSLSSHTLSFELLLADGRIVNCSRTENATLFDATLGGMGLTGMVLTVTLKLKPIETSLIALHSIKARNLDELMDLFEQYNHVTYSVAWIDCLSKGNKMGRSHLTIGEHATLDQIAGTKHAKDPLKLPSKTAIPIPIYFPNFALNQLTIKTFNFLYYNRQFKKETKAFVPYEGYFYPLDKLLHWNRIYGKRGFTQYQFVLPPENGREGMREIMTRISKEGLGSFLAVLKTFGPQDEGMIAFPSKGYTLALDFPLTKKLFPFLDELDELVASYGGRIYLTKDVRMKPEVLQQTYPRLEEFQALLKEIDPQQRIRSMQSERLRMHE